MRIAEALRSQACALVGQPAPAHLIGVGVDVVEIAEFDALPFDENQAFYRRVFTADETAYCLRRARPAQHFAARFAAKEAVVKACGAAYVLSPVCIEIARTTHGAPLVRFHSEVEASAALHVVVSLGHSETYACATAMAYAAGDGVWSPTARPIIGRSAAPHDPK